MAAPRATKRPKFASGAAPPQRGEDDYVPGNIVEIELFNFMTYDRLVCCPGPRLNLVVGPNGSGKSSLVCAIALGLAGDPSILGRASSVGAFVKRGEVAGHVKISLRGDTADDKICVTRKIDTKNKSEWLLNGATVTKKEVIDVIKKFNIQVNNLTQFLPQDRVSEFAKLSPIQLLEETEKAVGDPDLPIQHRQLVERSKELKAFEVAIRQNEQTLNNLKALNAEQERDVERVRLRDNLLRKAESMKKKVPWLKYDMMKKEFIEVIQEKEKIAKQEMEEAARVWEDSKGPIDKLKKHKATHTSNIKKISGQVNQNMDNRHKVMDHDLKLNAELKATFDEMDDLKKQEKSRQRRILKTKEDLAAAEKELEDLQPYELPKAEMAQLTDQIARISVEIKNLKAERNAMESQLKEMESKNSKLLQALRSAGADKIIEAYHWVQANKKNLRQEVYGPVLLEVNVQDKLHATYLEDHVPNYLWKSFITLDASDRDYIAREMKQYGIPVLNYLVREGTRRRPLNITPEMEQLGIYSRLDQVFQAPDTVKDVLISQAGLDDSYIGTDETHRRADEVSKLGIYDFWTPDNHYRWSKSRYSGYMSAFVDAIHPSRLFKSNLDVSGIEDLRLQKEDHVTNIEGMREAIKTLHRKQRQLEDEEANIHRQKEEIINAMRYHKKTREEIQRRVDIKKRILKDISREDDVESSTRKLVNQVAKINDERFHAMIKLKDLLTEAVALKWSHTEKNMTLIELDTKIIYYILKCKTYFGLSLFYGFTNKMPTTLEELETAIQDTESEANSMLFLNQNVLQEYQNRQHEVSKYVWFICAGQLAMIESISNKLKDDKGEHEICCSEIETVKGKWLPTLRILVSKINDTFSRNFQEMAVAGEVSLDEHGIDFDHYGILIKVKFRQTSQLQVLSSHHQSGGERSVSTILYLVSLQDLTNCPFRVVDEINQGMDPINERKMFQQLVRAASQINTPQCFLLTPKLLPDLEYSDACSILNIMNGPWIEEPAKAWSSGDCWRTVVSAAGH
ncbi:Structural maintenance of chromosomes protein 5 [Zea mays]|uniref:Structural maintenance of chromosomes protein 5 n=1 Tax=Zea mays TaxID=4577 RepID=A0A1D6GTS2_MAIZE|nr:Structural maintenance of chromosomes protein 5 [Zea mays]